MKSSKKVMKAVGVIEILIAVFFASVSAHALFLYFTKSGWFWEWHIVGVPCLVLMTAGFVWAGYCLLSCREKAWLHQIFPLITVLVTIAYFIALESPQSY